VATSLPVNNASERATRKTKIHAAFKLWRVLKTPFGSVAPHCV